MIQMALQYFNPFLKAMFSIFSLKKSIIFVGISLTFIIEWVARTHFLGVSMMLILATTCNIIYNTVTGAIASHHEAKKCLVNEDLEGYNSKKFEAKKLIFIVFKFITFFGWLLIAKVTNDSFTGSNVFNTSFKVIGLIPVVLFMLHEFISANKNIKRRYNKYPYLITPIMKLFDALENKFDKLIG